VAVFEYECLDARTSLVAGTIIADTARQARDQLRDRGLSVVDVKPAAEARKRRVSFWRRRKDQAEVGMFVRRLSTLLRAGIPLLSSLHTLVEQQNGRFRVIIQHLADQVAAGTGLAEAMRSKSDCFDELCVSIVEVGENTGSLEDALGRLADFKEKAHRLKSGVATALMYPMVVCIIGLAVTVFLMTYVVPNLLKALVEAGKDLPAVTRTVKAASDFLIAYWWVILGGVAGVLCLIKAVLKSPRGRQLADRLVLKIPVLGDLIRKENTSRVAVVMATLLRSGLQFTDAIRITRQTLRNSVFREAMETYESAVAAGSDVAGPLKESGVFSPMVVQMLAVGQQSGELEEMLEQLSDSYDAEVSTATTRLTRLLEPMLIVILAILIGIIAMATILPIMEASNVL
jgi:type II secretory pathway component PulF